MDDELYIILNNPYNTSDIVSVQQLVLNKSSYYLTNIDATQLSQLHKGGTTLTYKTIIIVINKEKKKLEGGL